MNNTFWTSNGTKISLKLFWVIFLGLLMLIPAFFVQGIIEKREEYRNEATQTISEAWGSEQTLILALIKIPFKTKEKDAEIQYAYFYPDTLNVNGNIIPEERHKGIFKKIVYTTDLKVSGDFPSLNKNKILENRIVFWDQAIFSVGIKDTKGIQGQPILTFSDQKIAFEPSTEADMPLVNDGMHTYINLAKLNSQANNFSFDLNLRGTDSLKFRPIGKKTSVKLQSSWGNPNFIGKFLPTKKVINAKDFSANWNISYLSRSFPQSWIGETTSKSQNNNYYYKDSDHDSSNTSYVFGVNLLNSVDFYRSCLRAAKYAILFIALTFLTYFMFEIVAKLKIHAFQYILIGSALSLFYLILLSLSEVISFLGAYLLAALANISLISAYTKVITKNTNHKLFLFMIGILIFLYSFLYVLLQLQDLSLLFGSIGLFIILCIIMYISRNIDWHGEVTNKPDKEVL
jgi:inner membrane protein